MSSSHRPVVPRVFYNSCYKNGGKGFPNIRKGTKLKIEVRSNKLIRPVRRGHILPSKCRRDMNQEKVNSLIVKHDILNLNNEVVDSCNSSCNDNVHFLLVENEVNTLSVSHDIEHNMNHVDQTGS